MRSGGGTDSCAGLVADDHVVHEVIENVPCIHLHLGQGRNDTIDSEWLLTQLPGFDHLPCGLGSRRLCPNIVKIFGSHIAALAIRADHLEPGIAVLIDQHDLSSGLILR